MLLGHCFKISLVNVVDLKCSLQMQSKKIAFKTYLKKQRLIYILNSIKQFEICYLNTVLKVVYIGC